MCLWLNTSLVNKFILIHSIPFCSMIILISPFRSIPFHSVLSMTSYFDPSSRWHIVSIFIASRYFFSVTNITGPNSTNRILLLCHKYYHPNYTNVQKVVSIFIASRILLLCHKYKYKYTNTIVQKPKKLQIQVTYIVTLLITTQLHSPRAERTLTKMM